MKTKHTPKNCPVCHEKSKIYKIEAFRVFFQHLEIVNYWTTRGRNDVVERANKHECAHDLERVAKESHDYHYSCELNSCHIPKDYVEKPEKYKLFKEVSNG